MFELNEHRDFFEKGLIEGHGYHYFGPDLSDIQSRSKDFLIGYVAAKDGRQYCFEIYLEPYRKLP